MRTMMLLAVLVTITLAPVALLAADEDIAKHPSCKLCGMNRTQWNFSRVYLELPDNSSEGLCSIRCLAAWMAVNIDAVPTAIRVADMNTTRLLDAEEEAVWVIGGKKPGVMTQRAKWAFGDRAAADSFIVENGGSLAAFDQVLKGAYEDMYEDNTRIRERRAAKRKAAMEKEASKP